MIILEIRVILSVTEELSFRWFLQPQELQRFNCACGFIGKSARIKYHQLLSKVKCTNGKSPFDQLATALSPINVIINMLLFTMMSLRRGGTTYPKKSGIRKLFRISERPFPDIKSYRAICLCVRNTKCVGFLKTSYFGFFLFCYDALPKIKQKHHKELDEMTMRLETSVFSL